MIDVKPRRRSATPSLDAVWVAIVAAYPFIVLNFSSLSVEDGDLWWTLAIGRAIWEAASLPASDPLSFNATTSGAYHAGQWLANMLLFGAYRLGGFELLVALRAAWVAIVFAVLYLGCRRAGARPPIAGICTLLAFPIVNLGLSLRPQLLALLPFVLYLEATRHPRSWGRATLLLPIVMVFWVNVHGSFVFGLALVAIAMVGRALDFSFRGEGNQLLRDRDLRALAALLLASVLAALVFNPRGPSVIAYVLSVLTVAPARVEAGGLLTEWVPTRLDTPGGPAFFATAIALAALFVAALARPARAGDGNSLSRRSVPLDAAEVLRLLFAGLFALRSVRGIVWWGLVLPAPLARLVELIFTPRTLESAASPPQPSPVEGTGVAGARPWLNGLLLGVTALVAVASLPWLRGAVPGLPMEARSMIEPSPTHGVVDWLAANGGTARPFHYIGWGPYFGWRLGPGQRTFADGRFEVYDPRVYDDYARISSGGPDWEADLAQYGIDRLVLSRTWQPDLVQALKRSSVWQLVYVEDDALVYRPRGSP